MDDGPWFSANETWSLSDTEILKAAACVHPKHFIGTRAGKASKYAVLDIDSGSPYHCQSGFEKISALLTKAGIEGFNLYRSSHSGGWHIYIFFDSPVSTRDLYKQLFQLFRLHDFEVAKGKLEIFPNPGDKSLGQGLRLPLQPGFAWLNQHNQNVIEERDEISPAAAILQFVRDIEASQNPYSHFHRLRAYVEKTQATRAETVVQANSNLPAKVLPLRQATTSQDSEGAKKEVRGIFHKMPPGINCDSWLRGRLYYEYGLDAPGQRADAVFTMGHYLFYGDPEKLIPARGYGFDDERRWLIEEVLKNKHHGNSKDIISGRAETQKHIERATSWIPPHRRGAETQKYEPVVPISWVRNNSNRALKAQQRIIAAVEDFVESEMDFSTRDLALKSGVSPRTINKYPNLWKPAQRSLRTECLETAIHEYNAVEGATCQKSQPPLPVQSKSSPSGLLAARRIIHELKMRDQREQRQKSDASRRSQKVFFDGWRDRVDLLMSKGSLATSEQALKILIANLARELLISPCEEECNWLLAHISRLKERLLLLGRPVQLPIHIVDSNLAS